MRVIMRDKRKEGLFLLVILIFPLSSCTLSPRRTSIQRICHRQLHQLQQRQRRFHSLSFRGTRVGPLPARNDESDSKNKGVTKPERSQTRADRFEEIVRKTFKLNATMTKSSGKMGDNSEESLVENESRHLWNPPASWRSFAGGIAFGVILTIGLASREFLAFTSSGSSEEQLLESVTLFEEVVTQLQREYVDEVDPRRLFATGVEAMLQSLDPYTEFESLRAAQDMRESVSGRYGGLVLSSQETDQALGQAHLPVSRCPLLLKRTTWPMIRKIPRRKRRHRSQEG